MIVESADWISLMVGIGGSCGGGGGGGCVPVWVQCILIPALRGVVPLRPAGFAARHYDSMSGGLGVISALSGYYWGVVGWIRAGCR